MFVKINSISTSDSCFNIVIFKDRKCILKSFKTYVVKICKEEYGHMVALALFDVIDDTKLAQKAFLDVSNNGANL